MHKGARREPTTNSPSGHDKCFRTIPGGSSLSLLGGGGEREGLINARDGGGAPRPSHLYKSSATPGAPLPSPPTTLFVQRDTLHLDETRCVRSTHKKPGVFFPHALLTAEGAGGKGCP